MTFGAVFPRVMRPAFGPGLAAASAASNWWLAGDVSAANAIGVYQPLGAADYAASKVNLANPGTYNAADGTAYPTHASATGWTFDGITQRLETNIIPTNTQAWSILVRFSNFTNYGSLTRTMSDTSTWPRLGFFMDQNNVYYYQGGLAYGPPGMTGGVVGVVGTKGYRDGVDVGLTIGSRTGGYGARTIPIGASRDGLNTWTLYYTGNIQAFAVYDTTLTAPQVAAVSAAMAAL